MLFLPSWIYFSCMIITLHFILASFIFINDGFDSVIPVEFHNVMSTNSFATKCLQQIYFRLLFSWPGAIQMLLESISDVPQRSFLISKVWNLHLSHFLLSQQLWHILISHVFIWISLDFDFGILCRKISKLFLADHTWWNLLAIYPHLHSLCCDLDYTTDILISAFYNI